MLQELMKGKRRILTGIHTKDELNWMRTDAKGMPRQVEEISASTILPMGGVRIEQSEASITALELPNGEFLVIDSKEEDQVSQRLLDGYSELMSDYRTFLEEQMGEEQKADESDDKSFEILEPDLPQNMSLADLDEEQNNHLTMEKLSTEQDGEELCQ